MANSPAVGINVLQNTLQTYVIEFAVDNNTPHAGDIINFSGFLSIFSNQRTTLYQGGGLLFDNERVEIQILGADNQWHSTGVATTATHDATWGGRFTVSVTIDGASIPPGNYQFRAHYAGNSGKGLLGCE